VGQAGGADAADFACDLLPRHAALDAARVERGVQFSGVESEDG
jgi:hypothetical protein